MLKIQRSTCISWGLVAFLLGLVVAWWLQWRLDVVWVLALVPVLFFGRGRKVFLLLLMLFGFCLGLWRGGVAYANVAKYQRFYHQDATVVGVAKDDPVYDDRGMLDFRIDQVRVNGTHLTGQMRIRGFASGIRRGDAVRVRGKVYPGFGNYQASVSFAQITVTNKANSPLETLRRRFFAAVYSVLPEPQGSMGLGFLVGLHASLPKDLNDQLRVVGLTHIVVASGYNLTVLIRVMRRLLARFSKYQSTVGSVALIVGFLAVTGASPSMVRASVVTLLSLWAWYYGRRFHPVLIILLGAALTAGYDPLFLWSDIGWWLSFLAFAGVLLLGPLITWRIRGKKRPPLLAQVAIETIAAQIMAAPLILFIFGNVSLVALLANVAVVPVIPFAMAATFVAGLAGMLLPVGWAAWLGLPARLSIRYTIEMVQLFASPAWAQQKATLGWMGLAVLYAVVAAAGWIIYRKTAFRFRQVPELVE